MTAEGRNRKLTSSLLKYQHDLRGGWITPTLYLDQQKDRRKFRRTSQTMLSQNQAIRNNLKLCIYKE
jgi:hypothetical protein